jgi:putative transposase
MVEEGLANAVQACRALGLARSSYYLAGQKRLSSQKLERKIIALSEEHPRYGYRRIRALMRRKGKPINTKRVQRVRRQAGLQIKERQRRTRRLDRLWSNGFERKMPTKSGVGICSMTKQSMAAVCGS